MPEPVTTLLPFSILFYATLVRLVAPRRLPRTVLAYSALALIVLCALISGVMDSAALAVAAILFLVAANAAGLRRAQQTYWIRWTCTAGLLLVAAVLMLHAAPGFDNPVIKHDLQLSPNSTAFDLYWNLDKGLVGLAFLLYLVPVERLGQADLRALTVSTAISVILAATLLPAAVAAGMLAWDPKLPAALLWWVPANLLITCLTEEAVFRGFLQERLSRWFSRRLRYGELLAVTATAVLFGAAHFTGGVGYVLFAAIAGFGYGLAYRYGGGLLGAILAHFLVNTAHFLLFTYPMSA